MRACSFPARSWCPRPADTDLPVRRDGKFATLGLSNLVRASAVVATQLGLSLVVESATGLLMGYLAGAVLGMGSPRMGELAQRLISSFPGPSVCAKPCSQDRLPALRPPRTLIHAITQQSAVLAMAISFGRGRPVNIRAAYRILGVPLLVLGDAIRAVMLRADSVSRGETFRRSTFSLAAAGLLPALVAVAYGPSLFTIIFGAEWSRAGEYAQWLVGGIFLDLVALPAAGFHILAGRQRFQLWLESVTTVLKFGGFGLAIWTLRNDLLAVQC